VNETLAPPRTAPVMPRLERESLPAPRLEAQPLVLPPVIRPAPSSLGLVAGGAAVLILGLALLQTGNFVASQFDRAAWLGWLTLAVSALGFGLIAAAVWRELRGLLGLRHVDHLRTDLGDPARAQAAAQDWLAGLPQPSTVAPAIAATTDPAAIAALLLAGPLATLRAQADALGRDAALQVFAVAAAVPSPAFDGLLVGWRGLRLIREVAALYGLRPGTLGTFALLRRTVLSAAGVMGTDLAAETVARAMISNPLLQHLAGDVAGAGLAARRMILLSRAAATACAPLPSD
jgi:putative membrane protein